MPAEPRFVSVRPRMLLELVLLYAVLVLIAGRIAPASTAATLAATGCLAVVSTLLLHEFAHALTARCLGVRVRALTLRGVFSAAVRRDRIADRRSDVLICLAGPAVNVVLLAGALTMLACGSPDRAAFVTHTLVVANLVALVGALPPFPRTDGTRAWQAWRRRDSPLEPT